MEMKQYLNGIQHIAIPTKSVQDTAAFYEGLGFELTWKTNLDGVEVAFLSLNNLTIETYEVPDPKMTAGAFDHISIDVSDVEKCFEIAKAKGYKLLDSDDITELPFFEKGVRFFKIEGVNKEAIEFNQIL